MSDELKTGPARVRKSSKRKLAWARWRAMVYRCTDPTCPSWKDYGGRGIAVCDEWRNSFPAFYAYIGDAPEGKTLDRIDNDGGYEPGNVRWATPLEQVLNRRTRVIAACPAGHAYVGANIGRRRDNGYLYCKQCERERNARRRSA